MNKRFFSANEITDEFSKKYGIKIEDDEDARRALRQKITRSLKNTGLWDKGIDDRHGKKKERLFTSSQVFELEMSEEMYDYLRERSTNYHKEDKRYKELFVEIEDRREKTIQMLSARTNDSSDHSAPVLTDEYFESYKERMMLKAIFDLYFTPIDEDLLRTDLYRKNFIIDEMNLEPSDIECKNRLDHPGEVYYTRRKSVKRAPMKKRNS